MKKALLFVTLSALSIVIYCQSTWSTSGRQIMRNNQPFVVKGVNYAPIPPGIGPDAVIQWGDMFHRDWAHLHDRDIPLMRAAGVNSIRIYQLQLTYPETDIALDHVSFLDKLYNGGDRPIYLMVTVSMHANFDYIKVDADPGTGYCFKTKPPYNEWWCIDDSKEAANSAARQANLQHMVDVAQKYGNHPAVMGFVVGNENNNAVTRENCKYWQWIDDVAKAVKQAAPGKLTSTTVVDDSMDTPTAAQQCNALLNLDVWGINSYRGNTEYGFDNLFDTYSAVSTKPLLITEFGSPGTTHNAEGEIVNMPQNAKGQADYLAAHWRDIEAHASSCSGGYVFQWVDEWWKGNYWLELNPSPWAPNPGFPGGWGDEEGFGVVAVMPDCTKISEFAHRVDPVEPRAAYYVMGQLFGAFNTLPAETYADFDLITCRRDFDPNPPQAPSVPTQPQTPTSAPPTDTPVHVTPIDEQVPSSTPPATIITPQAISAPQFPNNNGVPSSASVVAPLSILFTLLALMM